MSNLAVFSFESYEVRTTGTPNDVWFVASDVCKALELEQVSRCVSRLDDDERGVTTINLGGRKQEVNTINESGLS